MGSDNEFPLILGKVTGMQYTFTSIIMFEGKLVRFPLTQLYNS